MYTYYTYATLIDCSFEVQLSPDPRISAAKAWRDTCFERVTGSSPCQALIQTVKNWIFFCGRNLHQICQNGPKNSGKRGNRLAFWMQLFVLWQTKTNVSDICWKSLQWRHQWTQISSTNESHQPSGSAFFFPTSSAGCLSGVSKTMGQARAAQGFSGVGIRYSNEGFGTGFGSFKFLKTTMFTGWWFQTFFVFHNIWDNPSHWLSYFSRWLEPPTSLGILQV